jgi:hypothetical protein
MKDRATQESPQTSHAPAVTRRPYVKAMLLEFGSAVELTRNNLSTNMNDGGHSSIAKT